MHEEEDAQLNGKGREMSVHRESCGEATRQFSLVLNMVQQLCWDSAKLCTENEAHFLE